VGFYKNSKITFIYTIPEDYPYKAPIVKCMQRVFHPNIDAQKSVCLSILKDNWQANN
jgi:ubiquitin-conjugating enzyme E2 M